MGGLYGSEYWTYLLPRRVGAAAAAALTQAFAPVGAGRRSTGADRRRLRRPARHSGGGRGRAQRPWLMAACAPRLEEKRRARGATRASKPLRVYRAEELAHIAPVLLRRRPGFHEARRRFVYKLGAPCAVTPATARVAFQAAVAQA